MNRLCFLPGHFVGTPRAAGRVRVCGADPPQRAEAIRKTSKRVRVAWGQFVVLAGSTVCWACQGFCGGSVVLPPWTGFRTEGRLLVCPCGYWVLTCGVLSGAQAGWGLLELSKRVNGSCSLPLSLAWFVLGTTGPSNLRIRGGAIVNGFTGRRCDFCFFLGGSLEGYCTLLGSLGELGWLPFRVGPCGYRGTSLGCP